MSDDRIFFVAGATGATGAHLTRLLLERGHHVRAFVHRDDGRSQDIARAGADVVVGDLRDLDSVSAALHGTNAAYFVYPIAPGLIEATAVFAQAAEEAELAAIVNMSQISARRDAGSHAAQQHWIAERLLDRGVVAVTHLRPTFFAEWLLYFSGAIAELGVMALPFGNGRHAPIAAEDQARILNPTPARPTRCTGRSKWTTTRSPRRCPLCSINPCGTSRSTMTLSHNNSRTSGCMTISSSIYATYPRTTSTVTSPEPTTSSNVSAIKSR
jgi:uncharacterized protein YbjT (DUF2867 family)